jgi:hypothetical protein
MPILAGWLQDWMYNVYCTAGFAAVRLGGTALRDRGGALRSAALVAAGFALGPALASAQLLPSMELQALGPRAPGALKIADIVGLFGPVSLAQISHWIVDSPPAYPRFAYAGIGALVLAPLALARARWRGVALYFCLLAILSVVVALATNSPFFALYLRLPGATWFRLPLRILYLYGFAAAVLTALGCDALFRGEVPRRTGIAVALATCVAVALLLPVGKLASAYLLTATALVLLALATARLRGSATATLALLGVADVFVANRVALARPLHDLSLVERQQDLLDFIVANQGLDRTLFAEPTHNVADVMAKQGTLRGIWSATDYENLSLGRTGDFYRAIDRQLRGRRGARRFWGQVDLAPAEDALRQLEVMSLRFIVAPVTRQDFRNLFSRTGWRRAYWRPSSPWAVYESPRVLPRAYVSYNRRRVDEGQSLELMRQPEFDPWQTVMIEDAGQMPLDPPSVAEQRAITPARVVRYEPRRVAIDVDAAGPGLLVLTDTFYAGWRATVDGVAVPIYRANSLFRAVEVGAGRHRVGFAFRPTSFYLGAAVSLAAAIVIALLALAPLSSGPRV